MQADFRGVALTLLCALTVVATPLLVVAQDQAPLQSRELLLLSPGATGVPPVGTLS
jgi:hypothetical protein